ncbi:MAG: hypothetical protein M5U26_25785 [Planctomycetota bacterium]|nr:hypothetical protein [Planctomycetota bacterium]
MPLVLNRPVEGRWRAKFCWSAERGGPGLTARRFRNAFELASVPREFLVHVSADSRYRFWVNGVRAGRGPLKGELEHYFYETYDLAPLLKPGRNTIAAEVYWFGLNAPLSEIHSGYAGFLFEGPKDAGLETPGAWKVEVDRALTPDTTPYIFNSLGFLGHWEVLDGTKYPAGWEQPGFDDSKWAPALLVADADTAGNWGEAPWPWELFPREIPALVEEPRRFTRTIRDAKPAEHLFGASPRGWTVPAGAKEELVLDAGVLTTGFPVLTFEGGRGATVRVIYAEAIGNWDPNAKGFRRYLKGVRDDLSSGIADGYRDTLTLPGGRFVYEPLHWRTFWFVRLEVEPGAEPVTLRDFEYRYTSYPQELKASFECAEPDLNALFEKAWRTLQLCSHETYEDCPYYEQLNYLFDTRLEVIQSYAMAGEREFAKRALRLFRDTMRPDGLIHCRVPSRKRQRIPYFALQWIFMLDEYWTWWGESERAFVSESLFNADGVLTWFRRHLREDGFLGALPFWSPVNGASDEMKEAVRLGGSTYMTGMFACALDAAARLHAEAGYSEDGERWRKLAARLREAVREKAWSEKEGLFLEAPGAPGALPTQHTQTQAILCGAATPEQTKRILERLTRDPRLARTVTSNTYDLARALEHAGAYGEFYGSTFDPWREMLAKRLSTLWETSSAGRSDCHAWNSWISYDFLTRVLGIQPARPGFAELRIRPLPGSLAHARGEMPTPKGLVRVAWTAVNGKLQLQARVPDGLPTLVELPGAKPVRFERGGRIELG